MKHRI